KLVPEVRLALSKLDLKMKLIPRRPVMSFSRPATSSCSCSDSITQGPAIRKKGWSRPALKPHRSMGCLSEPSPSRGGLGGDGVPGAGLDDASEHHPHPGPPLEGEGEEAGAARAHAFASFNSLPPALRSRAARTKPTNRGWPLRGVDRNS